MTHTVLRIITRPNRGGPLRQLEALVPALASLGWSGPLAMGTVEPHERDGRADLVRVGADIRDVPGLQRGIRPLADRGALKALRRLIDETSPDVIHTHLGKAGALGRLAARRTGIPVVHTLHGHHYSRAGLVGLVARAAERRLSRHAAAWITLSPSQRDDLAAVVGSTAAARIHVVAPGFDVASFAAVPPAPREALCVLWSGRHVPVKNVAYLIDAFEQTTVPATLTLLGGGPGLRIAQERVARSPRREDITVQDEVDDPRPFLAAHHMIVLTSLSEGTPLSVLEGMAAGRAVLSTAVGGVRDIVADGETGMLVPAGQPPHVFATALDRLLGDAALRSRLGDRAARVVAERFSAERLARDTVAVYEAVLSGVKP